MSEQRQPFDMRKFPWTQPLTLHMINQMARPGLYLHLGIGMAEPVVFEPGMDEFKDLKYNIGALHSSEDKEKTTRREQEDQDLAKLKTHIDEILSRYSDRKAWEQQTETEINSLTSYGLSIRNKYRSCISLVERYGLEITNRDILIRNNKGSITPAMVTNHEAWRRYISRVVAAQEHVPTGINWLALLIEDWRRRKEHLTKFWDMFEKEEPYKDKDIFGTVFVISISMFPRHDFLQRKWDEMRPKYGVFFEDPPTWMEWDVVS